MRVAVCSALMALSAPAYGAGVACPAGMAAFDVTLSVDRAALGPINAYGTPMTVDPDGFVYLTLATSRLDNSRTPVDAGGEYRGCVQLDHNGELNIGLTIDLVGPGLTPHIDAAEAMWFSVNHTSGEAEIAYRMERRVVPARWDIRSGLTVVPYPGMTIIVRNASN